MACGFVGKAFAFYQLFAVCLDFCSCVSARRIYMNMTEWFTTYIGAVISSEFEKFEKRFEVANLLHFII